MSTQPRGVLGPQLVRRGCLWWCAGLSCSCERARQGVGTAGKGSSDNSDPQIGHRKPPLSPAPRPSSIAYSNTGTPPPPPVAMGSLPGDTPGGFAGWPHATKRRRKSSKYDNDSGDFARGDGEGPDSFARSMRGTLAFAGFCCVDPPCAAAPSSRSSTTSGASSPAGLPQPGFEPSSPCPAPEFGASSASRGASCASARFCTSSSLRDFRFVPRWAAVAVDAS